MSRGKKVAITYIAFDGALGSYTGIGVLSEHFIKQFPVVAKHFKHKDVNLALHVIAMDSAKSSAGYSKKIHSRTESICSSHNGALHMVSSVVNKDAPYSIYQMWHGISQNSANIIHNLASQYDLVVVYIVGHPVLGRIPYYYNQMTEGHVNVKLITVAHSDFFSYFQSNYTFEHLQLETASFQLAKMYDNTYVAATSKYQIGTLKKHYAIPKRKIVSFQTGLYLDDERFKPIPRSQIVKKLQSYKIPLDVDLVFSVGRAVPSKGFEDLLMSFVQLKKIHPKPVHLVFIASPNTVFEESAPTIERLKQIIADHHLEDSCTPIYKLDMELQNYIYQWNNTKIVAQLSLQESFGLVPVETRISPRQTGPVMVASNLGGHKEQITNGKDGFLVNPHNHLQTAKTMSKILGMSEHQQKQIKKAGEARVRKDYDYTKNVIKSLDVLMK